MDEDFRKKMVHIAQAVELGRYRYTIHAAQQRIGRGLQRHEIEEAIAHGEVIEDYPNHHYGPACLILGKTEGGKSLHLVCSLQPVVDLITVYEPDLADWENDLRIRRRKP